jgi:hypothetical protein
MKIVEYARSIGIIITGIYRDIRGVIQELLDLKKKNKKDIIPWGTIYSFSMASSKVCYIR